MRRSRGVAGSQHARIMYARHDRSADPVAPAAVARKAHSPTRPRQECCVPGPHCYSHSWLGCGTCSVGLGNCAPARRGIPSIQLARRSASAAADSLRRLVPDDVGSTAVVSHAGRGVLPSVRVQPDGQRQRALPGVRRGNLICDAALAMRRVGCIQSTSSGPRKPMRLFFGGAGGLISSSSSA
jgi:hypothetical protein